MSDPITPLTPAQQAARERKAEHEAYPERVLIALDQDLNVDTGGIPDETLSSRWARAAIRGSWLGKLGSRILDFFQKDHGANAMAGDMARAERIIETETKAEGEMK